VLIGFSNSIRGAKRFTASRALGDSDNDISCHARKYGTGRDRVPIAVSKAGVLFTHNKRTIWAIRNVLGACVLLRFPAAPNLSFPRFACGPLEMLSNFAKSFVKLLLDQAQQQAKLRESAKKDEVAN